MIQFIELIGVVKKEASREFKIIPAIVTSMLIPALLGTTVYVLINSILH